MTAPDQTTERDPYPPIIGNAEVNAAMETMLRIAEESPLAKDLRRIINRWMREIRALREAGEQRERASALLECHDAVEVALEGFLRAKADSEAEVETTLAQAEVSRRRSGRPMLVYAIRNRVTGAIKIGISKNPASRLASLQTATGDHLELVGAAGHRGKPYPVL